VSASQVKPRPEPAGPSSKFGKKSDLGNEFPFKCELCPLKVKEKGQLSAHNDLLHLNADEDETPFKCGLCSATFSQVMALDVHCRY
jgi:uncharacterized Zn-finger protein